MTSLLWFLLGAACVVIGQLIGWRLAVLEAEVSAAAPPPFEREPTYREAAPAPEGKPELPFRCLWSATAWGDYCGKPCGGSGLCAAHEADGPLERLARRRGHERTCGDPSCAHGRPQGPTVVSLAAWRARR